MVGGADGAGRGDLFRRHRGAILAAALRVGGDNYRVAWTLLRDCPAAKDPRVYDRLLDLLQPEVPEAGPTIPAQHHAAYTRVQSEMEAAA